MALGPGRQFNPLIDWLSMTNVTWRKNADYVGASNNRRTTLASSPGNTLVCYPVRLQPSRGLSNKQKRFEFFTVIVFFVSLRQAVAFSKFENSLSYACLKHFSRSNRKTRPKEKCRAKKRLFHNLNPRAWWQYEYNPHIPSHQFLSLPGAHIIMWTNICPFHTPHRVPLT